MAFFAGWLLCLATLAPSVWQDGWLFAKLWIRGSASWGFAMCQTCGFGVGWGVSACGYLALALVHNVTYATACVAPAAGCLHKTTLCKIALGFIFWRVFLLLSVGAALPTSFAFSVGFAGLGGCAARGLGAKSMTKNKTEGMARGRAKKTGGVWLNTA